VEIKPPKPTIKGPAEWFTGDVWMDSIVQPDEHPPLNIYAVHFSPGARTAWHNHEGGQTLYVTEGEGLAQARGGPIVPFRAGEVLHSHAGEWHWHGASVDHFMTHLSLAVGEPTWGEHVTDAEYLGDRS
jgi:quercetin dioxygenase-like cupin family protein